MTFTRGFASPIGQRRFQSVMAARRYPAGGFKSSAAYRNQRTGGLLGIETKFLDIPCTGFAIPSGTGAAGGEANPTSIVTGCLSAPAQGDGATNREGKKIVIKSCLVQGLIDCDPQATQSTADTPPLVYVALVQDTQTNGVTLNSEDVFTNIAANGNLAASPFRNMSYSSRFKVLSTWSKQLSCIAMANDTGATGGVIVSGLNEPFTLSWKGLMSVNFTTASTTADVANVIDNSLHIVCFASDQSLTPTIKYSARIRFVG